MHSSFHSGLNLYFTSQNWLTPLSCQCMEMFMTILWSTPASLFVNLVPPCSLTFQHHMVCHLSWVESAKVLLVPVEPELVIGERSSSFGSRKFKTVMVGSSTHDWVAICWVKCSIFFTMIKCRSAWMRVLLTPLISYASSVLAIIITKSYCGIQKCNTNLGMELFVLWFAWNSGLIVVQLSRSTVASWWKSVCSSDGSLSLLFIMKLMMMVWHFVNDSHEVMTAALIIMLPQSIVVKISLQSHW
jgi:hypothetical protein